MNRDFTSHYLHGFDYFTWKLNSQFVARNNRKQSKAGKKIMILNSSIIYIVKKIPALNIVNS